MTNTAQTILAQLGGNRFLAMTGAKNLIDTGRGLRMDVARRTLHIELSTADMYDVTTIKLNRKTFECKVTPVADGVYAGDLRRTFESLIGYATSI